MNQLKESELQRLKRQAVYWIDEASADMKDFFEGKINSKEHDRRVNSLRDRIAAKIQEEVLNKKKNGVDSL